jgi:hypothetical protein
MDEKAFDRPVQIITGQHGSVIRRIDTTMQAVDYLLHRWPRPGGAKHLAARKACMAVLEGLKKSHVARKAFEAAADEADILVGGPTGNNPFGKMVSGGQ